MTLVSPTRIGQIAVTAQDLPRAISFYRDTLGLRYLFEIPSAAFFEIGGVRLMVGIPEGEFDHPASIIYYDVPSIHQAASALKERGVQFDSDPHLIARMPDHDLWMAFFRDSEANVLALMSEVRPEVEAP